MYSSEFFIGGRPGSSRPRTGHQSKHVSESQSAYGPKSLAPSPRKAKVSATRSQSAYVLGSSRPGTAPSRMVRDFTRVNKEALHYGMVNSKEQQRFRELGTGYVKQQKSNGKLNRSVKLPGPDHVYGTPSGGSENLSDTLALQHGRDWFETRHEQHIDEQERQMAYTASLKTKNQPTTTRTVMLRRKLPARTVPDMPSWQMSQFKSTAAPRVSTFRTSSAKQQATRRHQMSLPNNYGAHFGHGVPRNPAGMSRNL